MKNKYNILITALIPVFLFTACQGKKTGSATLEFTNIRRGNLERSVSSSGTINPVSAVKILPRMSGKVEKVFVDYNDVVSKGDKLAELNTDMLRLQRDQQYASVQKARANYDLQIMNYRSQEILAQRDLISEYELKTSKTSLDNQAAELAVAEANLRVIETEINQYAYITSPIDGIVLDRNINVGDTVVDSSNNNSSSIFTIAENMREMQIEAAVGELDISFIHRGQAVRFSLESLPGRSFTGTVENIRLVPIVSNNVVTYTVIIGVENRDGSLFPGMTCAVDFIVERSENALAISNAALRFQPTALSADRIEEMIFIASLALMDDDQRRTAIEAREQAQAAVQNSGNANRGLFRLLTGGGQTRQPPRPPPGQGRRTAVVIRNIWFINSDGRLEVMQVQIGINNGSLTEIRSIPASLNAADLEGKQIILRERL